MIGYRSLVDFKVRSYFGRSRECVCFESLTDGQERGPASVTFLVGGAATKHPVIEIDDAWFGANITIVKVICSRLDRCFCHRRDSDPNYFV